MNTIGIIGALEEEVAFLKKTSDVIAAKQIAGCNFFVAKKNGKNIVIVKCGVGKVNAGICAQVLVDHFGVDYIINIGVAGALHTDLKIGDVVISTSAVQHDMDTSALGDPVGMISGVNIINFPADEALVEKAFEIGKEVLNTAVYKGVIASGDQFISTKEQKAKIQKHFNAHCAEMEGAAIAHACYLNNIPFLIIRSMSDSADGNAEMSYLEFKDIAAENSSKIMEKLITAI
ncbi:MAG: 5'-methylthioadenosine/adenosylhomocysteine nucleosidase [Anaerotignaceae bacterium]